MTITTSVSTQNHVGSQVGQDSGKQKMQDHEETSKSEGTQAGGTLQNSHGHPKTMSQGTATRGGRDYPDEMGHDMHLLSNSRRSKSKSTEDMNVGKSKRGGGGGEKIISATESPSNVPNSRSSVTEANAEADGERRESRYFTGDGPEALQLLQ